MVLLDCAHSPVGVQLVLPDHTAMGLPLLFSSTANLLCPIWAELLNIRFWKRLPISAESVARAALLVTSQTVALFGFAPAAVFFGAAFFDLDAFFALFFFAGSFLVFLPAFFAGAERFTMDFAAAAMLSGAPALSLPLSLPAVDRISFSRA